MKKCIACGIEKSLDCYYILDKMKDGHLNKCKECSKDYSAEQRDKKNKITITPLLNAKKNKINESNKFNNNEQLIDRFIEKVCNYFGSNYKEAFEHRKSRKQPWILIRYFVYYHLRKKTNISLDKMGLIFNQPHDTVAHAINSLENWNTPKIELYKKDIKKKALILKGKVSSVYPKDKLFIPKQFTRKQTYNLLTKCFDIETADKFNKYIKDNEL